MKKDELIKKYENRVKALKESIVVIIGMKRDFLDGDMSIDMDDLTEEHIHAISKRHIYEQFVKELNKLKL